MEIRGYFDVTHLRASEACLRHTWQAYIYLASFLRDTMFDAMDIDFRMMNLSEIQAQMQGCQQCLDAG